MSSTGGLSKKSIILCSIATLAAVTLLISAIVGFSVKSVTDSANRLDFSRSRSTVNAALQSVATQLDGLIRDNAIWDDAAMAAYSNNDIDWMIESWGKSTEDYPLYNVAMVVESSGKPVIAYRDGLELTQPPSEFFGASFEILLQKVAMSKTVGNQARVETAFVMTPDGLAALSIGPIQPSSPDVRMEQRPQRYLVFSRSITAEVLADLSQAHVVPGLVFETQPDGRLEQSPVTDASGQVIGFLAWPSQLPGTASFEEVAPYLLGALTLLVALLGGFALLSRFIVIDIHRERIKAEYQATHDALSGLLNRNGMFNSLDRLIGEKTAESIPALVYLDLDGFKDVNDSYGHAVGDTLIRIVSSGLSAIASGDTLVSRLGGDEFALLLKSGPGCERTDEVATAIHDLFKEIIDIDGRSIIIGASIGIATAEDEDVDAAELVRRADLAMYSAKDRGRGRTAYYVPAMDADRTYKNLLETDLRNAIAADSLTVAYQPLVDARTSLWHGVEALARWRNERTGQVIGPDVFIPIAERSGLIEMLGLQILRKALEATKNWPDLKVSVNVSPAQFRNPAFPEQVRQLLRQTGADPNLLTLEITEGFFIRNPERARRIVTDIKAMGISISLDDFGSGCSSIGYLRQFEFDRLKIDRSLVTALDHEANASNVILATVALANAFNIPVTAEGIESEEQAAILRLTGCDEFQGYLFGKPMSADEVGQIIHGLPSMASFA